MGHHLFSSRFAGGGGWHGLGLPFPIKVLCSEGVGRRVGGARRHKDWWLGLLSPILLETPDEGGGGRKGAGRRES